MRQPIYRLRREHECLRHLLDVLERQLVAVRNCQDADYHLMHEILHSLVERIGRQQYSYKNLILEKMVLKNPSLSWLSEALRLGRERRAQSGIRCLRALEGVLNDCLVERVELFESGVDFVAQYRRDIRREDEEVFLALESLSPADWLSIENGFVAQGGLGFVDDASSAYRAVVDQIEIVAGVLAPDDIGVFGNRRSRARFEPSAMQSRLTGRNGRYRSRSRPRAPVVHQRGRELVH